MPEEVWEVVEQLKEDEALQAEFLADPKKWLSDRGVSAEMVERLIPALMAAVITGGVVLQQIEPLSVPVGWR